MADGDGTSTKPRQFTIDGEGVDLLKTIQARLTPTPNQPDTIKWGLKLLEQQTRRLQPKSQDELLAEILGVAS